MKKRILFCLGLFFFNVLAAQQNTSEQLAAQYYSSGEYEKALSVYEDLFSKNDNDFYYSRLIDCCLNLKRFSDAEKIIKRCIRKNPKNLTYYADWGFVLEKNGRHKQAERQYETAFQKIGYDRPAIENLAASFEKYGHIDLAVKTYEKAGEKFSNPFAYVYEMASLYEKSGDSEKMFSLYFDYLKKHPFAKNQVQLYMQQSVMQNNGQKYNSAFKNTLAKYIAENPKSTVFQEMMIWFSLQKKDFDFAMQQAKAIDLRFPDDQGFQVFQVANIAKSNGAYDVASEAYGYILGKGRSNGYYYDCRIGLLECRFLAIDGKYGQNPKDIDALLKEYEKAFAELGKNAETVQLMRNYAHILAYYKNDAEKAADILEEAMAIPYLETLTVAKIKLELGDILLSNGFVWDATLLYMQVGKAHKNDVVGSEAKFRNARLSYYNTDFEWAKSQLDVLRASTSKLIANDAMQLSLLISDNIDEDSSFNTLSYFAKADFLIFRKKYDEALKFFDTIEMKNLTHPLFDEILMRKSDIAMKRGDYRQADSLLQKLVDFYPEDILADDALFMLAELNETRFGNKDKAVGFYEKILLDYTGSLYVVEARKRYNLLKTN